MSVVDARTELKSAGAVESMDDASLVGVGDGLKSIDGGVESVDDVTDDIGVELESSWIR